MKVALTVWDGRVSPLFDVSRDALILTVEKGAVVSRRHESIEAPSSALKLERLVSLGVDTLVCGAISEFLRQDLAARGMEVLGFVAGEIEEVVQALVSGTLPCPALSMPGCRDRQRRRGQGKCQENERRGSGGGRRRRRGGRQQKGEGRCQEETEADPPDEVR